LTALHRCIDFSPPLVSDSALHRSRVHVDSSAAPTDETQDMLEKCSSAMQLRPSHAAASAQEARSNTWEALFLVDRFALARSTKCVWFVQVH